MLCFSFAAVQCLDCMANHVFEQIMPELVVFSSSQYKKLTAMGDMSNFQQGQILRDNLARASVTLTALPFGILKACLQIFEKSNTLMQLKDILIDKCLLETINKFYTSFA